MAKTKIEWQFVIFSIGNLRKIYKSGRYVKLKKVTGNKVTPRADTVHTRKNLQTRGGSNCNHEVKAKITSR